VSTTDDLCGDFEELQPQTPRRPILDRLGFRQIPQEIAEIAGENMKLKIKYLPDIRQGPITG
jgi:hypothetical protein